MNNLKEIEKKAIMEMVESCDNNLAEAAKRLGIGRSTIYRRLRSYGWRRFRVVSTPEKRAQ